MSATSTKMTSLSCSKILQPVRLHCLHRIGMTACSMTWQGLHKSLHTCDVDVDLAFTLTRTTRSMTAHTSKSKSSGVTGNGHRGDLDSDTSSRSTATPPSYIDAYERSMMPDPDDYDPRLDQQWDTNLTNGRLEVNVDLSAVPTLTKVAPPPVQGYHPTFSAPPTTAVPSDPPSLNIVILIVGSRGDVQPYLALATRLMKHHRVRIGTHEAFKSLVESYGAGFYDIGGDPAELMAYMVKNPGLLPGIRGVLDGDVRRKRRMVRDILYGCHKACYDGFAADAIIANPPGFAHVHIAEAMGIPLIMSFTMPWTPTTSFPHPLVTANSKSDKPTNNWASFVIADALMWQGLGDLINAFRVGLGLRPLSLTIGPLLLHRLQIPHTYAWSEALLPKPSDWRDNIDVVGFYTSPGSHGTPDPELAKFVLGTPPVYIGFGSIVVANPENLTQTILQAVKLAGVRAVISAGWAKIGGVSDSNVFVAQGNVPHDWLFSEGRVSAVIHHGGAGTTSAGLREGVPTVVVPFFGDQWFWGTAVNEAGAGPPPIPYAQLTAENLSEAIKTALLPETKRAAGVLGERIRGEDGVKAGVESLIKHLPIDNMRCNVNPAKTALWWCERHSVRLSGVAAAVLVEERLLSWKELKPYRSARYDTTRHYADPLSGIAHSVVNLGGQAITGTGKLFYSPIQGLSNLVLGVPKASFDVVSSLQEGLENMPGIVGAPVRQRSRVTTFSGGVAEGVKGLGWGIVDGLSGLVTEPMKGAKKGGLFGALDGAMAGVVSLPARMASGGLGLVVHPATGAWRGAKAMFFGDSDSVLFKPRKEASETSAKTVGKDERNRLVHTWAGLLRSEEVDSRRAEVRRRRADAEGRLLLDTQLQKLNSRAMWGMWQKNRAEAKAAAARPDLARSSTAPMPLVEEVTPVPRRSMSTSIVPERVGDSYEGWSKLPTHAE